jgi:hypothetical protein
MILGLLLLLASSPAPAPASVVAVEQAATSTVQPNWEADVKRRRDALIARNGPGTDGALRAQLIALAEQDQAARGFQGGAPVDKQHYRQATNLMEIDKGLTEQLKQIVTAKGWPTIAMVGMEASNAAMLILTHTADHEWQRSLLPQLERLADSKLIDGSSLALVIDKDLTAHGQPQRYGSQFKLVDGQMAMIAVEDPGSLDRLRAEALLPPMDVYKRVLANLYHLPISKQIVAPTAADAPQQ